MNSNLGLKFKYAIRKQNRKEKKKEKEKGSYLLLGLNTTCRPTFTSPVAGPFQPTLVFVHYHYRTGPALSARFPSRLSRLRSLPDMVHILAYAGRSLTWRYYRVGPHGQPHARASHSLPVGPAGHPFPPP
jgi:hypothetical protein